MRSRRRRPHMIISGTSCMAMRSRRICSSGYDIWAWLSGVRVQMFRVRANGLQIMSDRAIPRSFRMMQGFGVNTFSLINAEGNRHFVKFIWTPHLGVHSLVWDEALKIAGQDPDFHRKDLM